MLLKNKRFIVKAVTEAKNFHGKDELWITLQDTDDLSSTGKLYAHYNIASSIGTNSDHEYNYIKENVNKELRLTVIVDPFQSAMHTYYNTVVLYCDNLVIPLNDKCDRLFINQDNEIDYRKA
jgi:hypothetical protein